METHLTPDERKILLKIARQAVSAAAQGQPPAAIDPNSLTPNLKEPAASFVTLTEDGMLRGCIGALRASLPLAEDVAYHARAAALDDPRFPPLGPSEVDRVRIEISVLSNPIPLPFSGPEDLVRRLRPGVDGVILRDGLHQATFLPQVWEKIPSPQEFLSRLCEKAFLPKDAWRTRPLEVLTYQVESFEEA